MNIIIKSARIIDLESPYHHQTVDIKITNGIIETIHSSIDAIKDYKEISLDNLHVSKGWFDSSVAFGEPGLEERETLENGLEVAAKSGFTAIALQPNTSPKIDNQSQIQFVLQKAKGKATALYPIGALTQNSEGNDLAELFDMKKSGAVAFGDYKKSITNPNLQKIALQYVQDFDALIIAFSQDSHITGKGMVHEGIVSTQLGLKGIPAFAETLDIARNICILEYTGGKLHIPTLSCAKSVALIREAKAKGLAISCSVSVHHLFYQHEVIEGFDTRYKVLPPLRLEEDRQALLQGIIDGTIDCITSDHQPIDIENKKMEFDYAKYGTIGLESAFGALNTLLPLEIIIDKLTAGKKVFGIESIAIKEGNKANISLFNPEGNTTFQLENIRSKSKNSAFLGGALKGKVYGIYNQNKLVLA